LRLEPFDDERVIAWLGIWNRVNAANFAAARLEPLSPETVLHHRDLTGQPLLLLMLALYDADRNALQRLGSDLSAHELYEQLLRSFALREITKHRAGLPDRELHAAVENELRRLSVVGFAMFNRATQWVTEADLERDLAALQICGPVGPGAAAGMRAPLAEAELTLGRFFFIHRARASQDETPFQTYEFLHATFGEYLVARLTWQALNDLGARDAASSMSFGAGPAEDDLLRALLSFQPLSSRAPVIDFLRQMASAARPELRTLLIRRYRTVNHTPPGLRYADYRPQAPSEPARYATYAANLLLLCLSCDAGGVRGSELYPDQPDPVDAWHSQTLLWRALLTTDGWTSLVDAIDLTRVWRDDKRDIELTLDGRHLEATLDPAWTFNRLERPRSLVMQDLSFRQLRRKSHFQCSVLDDMVHHALEPLDEVPAPLLNSFVSGKNQATASAAHILADLWANPSAATMLRTLELLETELPWSAETYFYVLSALLDRAGTEAAESPALAHTIHKRLIAAEPLADDVRAQRRITEWAAGALSLTEADIRRPPAPDAE
jgi:hypothetical protein